MALSLQTYDGDFRSFKAVITARLAGVDLKIEKVDAKKESPNNVPVLKTSNGPLTQSNAIARYIARSRPEAGLFGASFFETAQVESWIDWGTNNVELPAVMSTYWQFGWVQFDYKANAKALADLQTAFTHLEQHLISRTYLVGSRVTLADVVIASQLFYPLKMSLDLKFRSQFPSVLRWFSQIAALPASAGTIGAVIFCKETPKPPKNQGAGKKKKKQKQPKQQPKKAAAPKPKKEKKPKNPLDALPKSSFDLEEWKRVYSNASSDYYKSMEWFWPNFDASGWSLWMQEFNHNDENTTDFIVSNKMAGFVQRTVAISKYAFGVMQMLNTFEAEGCYKVAGVWLIRGDSISPMDCNPEVGVYTWSKLDTSNEATKKLIADYWCGEAIDGVAFHDFQVFK